MTLPDREARRVGLSGMVSKRSTWRSDVVNAEARRDERKRLLLAGFLEREFTPQAR